MGQVLGTEAPSLECWSHIGISVGVAGKRQAVPTGVEGGWVIGPIIPAGRPPSWKLFLTVREAEVTSLPPFTALYSYHPGACRPCPRPGSSVPLEEGRP